jgi:hypothetical protein
MSRYIDPAMLTESADALKAEYLDIVKGGITNHPRSAQRRIGPSEIGNPCARALLHKLNKDTPPPRGDVAWTPAIGTALHNQFEEWFTKVTRGEEQHGRWEMEQRVSVGEIGGEEITGSTDLWDNWSHAVIDHKFVGKYKLDKVHKEGPGPQYRAQGHLYGRGWERAGRKVDLVMIAFVPRDGGDLDQTYFWWEQYNPLIAEGALARANQLFNLIQAVGIDAALSFYKPCPEPFCDWCSPGGPPRRSQIPQTRIFTPTH